MQASLCVHMWLGGCSGSLCPCACTWAPLCSCLKCAPRQALCRTCVGLTMHAPISTKVRGLGAGSGKGGKFRGQRGVGQREAGRLHSGSLVGPNVDLNGDFGGPGRPSEGWRTETQMYPRTHERTHILSHTQAHCRGPGRAWSPRESWPGAHGVTAARDVTAPARGELHLRLVAGGGELHICLVGN